MSIKVTGKSQILSRNRNHIAKFSTCIIILIKEKGLKSIFDVCNENEQGRGLLLYMWGKTAGVGSESNWKR